MMRNMKLSENNSCVCLSVFARKGLGVLAVAAFLLFAAGASVTKATSVDLIFNPNMAGNAIASATPCTGDAGPSGPQIPLPTFKNGVCADLIPGDRIAFAISITVDEAGVNAWSLDMQWDSSLTNALTLFSHAPPSTFYRGFLAGVPPEQIGYQVLASTGLQQSSATEVGFVRQVAGGITDNFNNTISDTSFRAGTVTFDIDTVDQAEIALGFFLGDGNGMGNSASAFITPDFGGFVVSPAPLHVENDFNRDGIADVLIQNENSGHVYILITEIQPGAPSIVDNALSAVVAKVPTGWEIVSLADMDGDQQADIILEHTDTGLLYVWITQSAAPGVPVSIDTFESGAPTTMPTDFSFAGTGDANGDGRADIYLENDVTGLIWTWLTDTDGISFESGGAPFTMPSGWELHGIADLNGDGSSDVVLVRGDGMSYYATTDETGLGFNASAAPGKLPSTWEVVGLGDYSGNYRNDLLVKKADTGQPWVFATGAGGLSWLSGASGSGSPFNNLVPVGWEILGISDYSSDTNLAGTLLVEQSSGAIYIFANEAADADETGFYGTVQSGWSLPIFQGK